MKGRKSMEKLIKTLIPLTTGIAVGVVVGRVRRNSKPLSIHKDGFTYIFSENGLASNLDVSKLTTTRSKFDELNSKVDSILLGDNSSLTIGKDKVYIKSNKIKLDGTIEFE